MCEVLFNHYLVIGTNWVNKMCWFWVKMEIKLLDTQVLLTAGLFM